MKKIIFTLLYILFLFTYNSKAQWVQMTNGIGNSDIEALALIGNNIIAGGANGVYLSTNLGESWTAINNGLPAGVQSIAVSGNYIFAGPDNLGVYRSSNNGANWIEVNNGLIINDAYTFAVSGTNIFVSIDGGAGNRIFKTVNNGTNWTNVTNDIVLNGDVSAFIVSGTNIFAGAGNGVHLTTNFGTNWIFKSNAISSVHAFAISGSNLYAGTYRNGIYVSSNNGTNWTAINNGLPNNNITNITIAGTNIIAGTDSNGVFVTTNYGLNWISKNTGLTNLRVLSLIINNNYIFAGTYNGGIFRRLLPEIIGIKKLVSLVPKQFDLKQNYPNPFNPSTNIRYEITKNSFVKLVVYNVLGLEVEKLVNEKQSLGVYEVAFNASQYPSGVYFYRLEIENFSDSKKMILLK